MAYDASGNTVVAPTTFAVHMHSNYDTAGNLIQIATTHASSDAASSRLADISYNYAVPPGTPCSGVTVGTKTDKRQSSADNLATPAKTTFYCYDSSGRLTQANTTGGPVYSYAYDKDSNRITDAAGNHTFNAANQLTDSGYAYDADGNLVSSPAFPTVGAVPGLAYNGVDQTTSITPAG